MSIGRFFYIVLTCLCALSLAPRARAEITPIERATAEALFQEAVALMDQGEYGRACEKFAGTLEVERGLGTMLHLADCYDKLGRTASSWALFEEVASLAKLSGDNRESIAAARANELESRLSLVYLKFSPTSPAAKAPKTLRVTIGESKIPSAMWNSPIPLDPGQQRIEVAADGYEPWSLSLVVAPGPSLRHVTIPQLTTLKTPKPVPVRRIKPVHVAVLPLPSKSEPPPSSAPRVLGYISGALGLVGLGVTGYLGYRAFQNQQDSLNECRVSDPNLCTPEGVEHRQDAIRFARAANVSAIAGGACLVLGTTLLIVSPSSPSTDSGAATRVGFTAFTSPTLSVRKDW